MSQSKTWAKGWRIVLTCNGCKLAIWSKNIGQTVRCRCEDPNFITDNPFHYRDGKHRHGSDENTYALKLLKVEEPY